MTKRDYILTFVKPLPKGQQAREYQRVSAESLSAAEKLANPPKGFVLMAIQRMTSPVREKGRNFSAPVRVKR